MLFLLLRELQDEPVRASITLLTFCLALVVAITFHEFSHALSATRLGDYTAQRLGRLSLNPLAHLDPLGTVMILFAGFGWGKPVPVNPAYLRTGGRAGMAMVSLAGPLSNIIMAFLVAIPIRLGMLDSFTVGFSLFRGQPDDLTGYIVGSIVFWNLLLAAFNLIPLAPLDGFKVALGILPRDLARGFARLEPYGPVILLLLIMLDFLTDVSIISMIVSPILEALGFVVLG